MSEFTEDTVTAIAELAVTAADADQAAPTTITPEASTVVRTIAHNRELVVRDLERLLPVPQRSRGHAMLTDPASFITYTQRLADEHSTVWAYERGATITAVFNDHRDHAAPGWRDHTAELALQLDPDWAAWIRQDGALTDQETFAEHVENLSHTITRPDPATMHTVASTFRAHRSALFERTARLDSGDVSLSYSEDTTAKAGKRGDIEVPEQFTVYVAPFIGAEPTLLTARLRYRIREGELRIGYQLLRPDVAVREAFQHITETVRTGLGEAIPVVLGNAPSQVLART